MGSGRQYWNRHKEAGVGQVGAGTVRAPLGCLENALTAYAKTRDRRVD